MLCFHRPLFIRSARVSVPFDFFSPFFFSLCQFDFIFRVCIFVPWIRLPFERAHFNYSFYLVCSDSEGELTLSAGDYLLVWGCGEPQGGYFDAELLDGRRGLVPASYVTRLIGEQ